MTTTAPDVGQLQGEKLADAPFPGGRRPAYRFYLDPAVHAGVWQHARDNITVEICGVLVGVVARDGDGPYAHVSAFIRGEAAANKLAEVTFTHDTWARINQEMDTKYADKKIVGWYHSHPDFGVFLSDRDKFIQEHFFSGPGQVAYVVDPVRGTEGVFVWKAGQPVLTPHYWVGDRVQVATAAGDERPPAAPAQSPATPESPPGPPAWLTVLTSAAWYMAVFLLGFLLSGYVTHAMTDLERFQIARDAKARALIDYGIRPGLGEELDSVTGELLQAAKETKALSDDHLKHLEDSGEMRKKWQDVLESLVKSAQRINQARAAFTPMPAETARMLQLLGVKAPAKADDKSKDGKDKGTTSGAVKPAP
jgi:proteasome lid subunit RPN8/RPN11